MPRFRVKITREVTESVSAGAIIGHGSGGMALLRPA